MKHTLTAAVAVGALALSACSAGVDRDGTRDQFIEDIEEMGSTADGDCVDRVFENYSDDDLTALSEGVENETTASLSADLIECTDLLGG